MDKKQVGYIGQWITGAATGLAIWFGLGLSRYVDQHWGGYPPLGRWDEARPWWNPPVDDKPDSEQERRKEARELFLSLVNLEFTIKVSKGETLEGIAQEIYGDGTRWGDIFDVNSPNKIERIYPSLGGNEQKSEYALRPFEGDGELRARFNLEQAKRLKQLHPGRKFDYLGYKP